MEKENPPTVPALVTPLSGLESAYAAGSGSIKVLLTKGRIVSGLFVGYRVLPMSDGQLSAVVDVLPENEDFPKSIDASEVVGILPATECADEPRPTFAEDFSVLAEKWRRETAAISNVHRMALHPSYQRIIGMGRDAIPFILKEISTRPGHWFWALHAITGEDPAPSGATFSQATDAWLDWGRSKGYL